MPTGAHSSPGAPVDDDRVALDERAAPGVLAGQAHRGALGDQRAEGDELAEGPVDPALARHLLPLGQQRRELGVRGEALGRADERVADPVDELERDGRGVLLLRLGLVLRLRAGGLQAGAVLVVGAGLGGLADLGEHALELVGVVAQRGLGLLDGDVAAADEGLGVQLADAALALDEVVHHRVGHRGVVALVVAAPAVADHVDDDVLGELLAELEGQPRHPDAGLRVVAVHVEDRRLDHPGHVGRVVRGPAGHRGGGEPDLVVDDDVDGAAGAVPAQLRQVEGLGDHALTGERRVAVDEDGQHGEVDPAAVEAVLLGPRDPLEDRVDRLQVRGVGRQVDLGALARTAR